jgi:malate dehydrogenase
MFAARQVSKSVVGAVQKRAFSASASNVSELMTPLIEDYSHMLTPSSTQLSKVAVLGAGGGIGQPLSLLLKLNPRVSELSLFDIRGAPGVAADVSHVNTKSTVCWIVKSKYRIT